MTIITTIKAGDLPKTIQLPEGQSLTLSGSAGASGVAYLLDQVLGGTNSLKSWSIGSGALAPIGPFAGTQQFQITCAAGSIDATVGDAVFGVASIPLVGLSRVLTRGPLNNSAVHGTGGPLATDAMASLNTASIKMDLESDFDEVQIIIGSYETVGNPLTGIKVLVAATETAQIDTDDHKFRPIVGGVKYNAIRNSTDLYGWCTATWDKSYSWDGASASPTITDLAHATTGTLPLAQLDSSTAQRPIDGPTVWSRSGTPNAALMSFVATDWIPCSSVPPADGGTRPYLLLRIVMPGDATHKWSYQLVPIDTDTPQSGSLQTTPAKKAAYRNRVYQAAYSFADNVSTLSDSFSFSSAAKIPQIWVRYRTRNGGITVMCVGDSITENTYVSDTVSTWGHRAACDVSTPSLPVSVVNCGFSGQSTATYWKQARNLMFVLKPDILTYCTYSQNDTVYTRRTSQDQLARAAAVLDYCTVNNIVPIVWTGAPVETLSPTSDTERRYVNSQILRMFSGSKGQSQVLDFNAGVSQGLPSTVTDLFKPDVNGNSYKFNATHPSEWAFENVWTPMLSGVLRALLGKS